MSWGTNEYYGEWYNENVFTTPAGHTNETFIAASGDQGAWSGPMFPSVSPNVLAVGGTSLTVDSGNTYGSETGWSYSTGGFSGLDNGYEYSLAMPSYQAATLTAAGLNYGIRTTPDVSFNAGSGVAVYDSVSDSGQSGWFDVGGTTRRLPPGPGWWPSPTRGSPWAERVRSAPTNCRPSSTPYPVRPSTTSRAVPTAITRVRGTIWSPVWAVP